MKNLTIVWQRPKNVTWEYDWIEYLFEEIPHITVENADHSKFFDNSIIIESICWAPYHNLYIKELTNRQYGFGLIHLTDESTNDDISSYDDCKFVLRNYYRKNMPDHVMHIPLGWNNTFNIKCYEKSIFDRQYIWSFIGERWDQNRNKMALAMKNIPNGYLYVANQHGARLSPDHMGEIYNNSIFIPCPKGAINIDNFRVTEAFEAGCIPIVEKNEYWTNMHGIDFPAIQIKDWNDVPLLILNMLKNKPELENLRLTCFNWWNDKKKYLKKSIFNFIDQRL